MKQLNVGFMSTGGCLTMAFLVSTILVLAGCGGSSSSDDAPNGGDVPPSTKAFNQDPATIEGQGDAEANAKAARKTAEQAIIDERVDPSSLIGGGTPAGVDILPTGAIGDVGGPCGGTARSSSWGDGGFRFDFNNFCTEDSGGAETIVNGYIAFRGSPADPSNYAHKADYTVTSDGETYSVQQACSENGCFNEVDSDGVSYRAYDVAVSEPDSNGAYDVSARVCTESEGCITYEATGLKECASGVGFSDGSISIKDSTDSAVVTVTFNGCTDYTVEFGGASYLVTY